MTHLSSLEARAALASATLDDLLIEVSATLGELRELRPPGRVVITKFMSPKPSCEDGLGDAGAEG